MAIFSWLVEWAAQLLTRYAVDIDGRSPYQRMRGREANRPVVVFGESVYYMPLNTSQRTRAKFGDKLLEGILLGVSLRTDECLIGTAGGAVNGKHNQEDACGGGMVGRSDCEPARKHRKPCAR